MERLLALLFLFASPAAAEMEVCQTALQSPGCFRSDLHRQAKHLVPEASWQEFTRLSADPAGRPMAEVFWIFGPEFRGGTIPNTEAITEAFALNVTKAVCSYRWGMGITLGREHEFVRAGGVVVYRLSVFGQTDATVTIDHCEAL